MRWPGVRDGCKHLPQSGLHIRKSRAAHSHITKIVSLHSHTWLKQVHMTLCILTHMYRGHLKVETTKKETLNVVPHPL